jgi:uncharacterized integral membrane protein (TIGR00698 family)
MVTLTSPRFDARKVGFVGASLLCLAPLCSLPTIVESFVAPAALIVGMVLALTMGNPFPSQSKRMSRLLLQLAVVCLGFSLQIGKVIEAGSRGLAFSCVSILLVFGLGFGLRKLLQVRPVTSLLVSAGTAICGGSAIAAMSTAVDAPQEDVTVAVGTVFLLNAVALVIFPPIGHALGLTPTQFGTWAGIAIHDVSSVVGAATSFGASSLATATAVKLSRVIFLVPATLICAFASQGKRKATIPWFVGFFLLASLVSTGVPAFAPAIPSIRVVALCGFALSLFLIGSGLNRQTLKSVGVRPMMEGVLLWVFISVISLVAVRSF